MAKTKPKPKRRIWRKLALILGGVVVFLLMFVSAFIFNPFEGSLLEMRDIVPRGVNFFVRKQQLAADFTEFPEPAFWPRLAESPGFEDVRRGSLGQSWGREIEQAVTQAEDASRQLREATGGWVDLMGDLIGRELIVAGYNQDYSQEPARPLAQPRWCVYTRVSWKIKAALGLAGFGFVAGMAADGGVQIASDDGVLVVTSAQLQEPIYVKRHLDVLMISNYRGLLDQAQRLIDGSREDEPIGRQPAYTDGAIARIDQWAIDNDVDTPNVAEFVVEPNAFDAFRRKAAEWPNPDNKDSMNERVLASFLNLKGWRQIAGGLLFKNNVLGLTGEIGLNSKQHTAFQSSFYTAEQQRREQWLDRFLNMVPESACAAAALRMPAAEFLHAMFDALNPDEKELINDSLRRCSYLGTQLSDARDLIERIRLALRSRTGFIFRRNIPDKTIDKETGQLLIPVAAKSPMPQVAWVFWLRPEGKSLIDELIKMMTDYRASFGFRKVWHLPIPYAGGKLPEPVTEFTNPQIPATGEIAMILLGDFFVMSNSGPLIKDILLTHYGTQTGAKSITESADYEQFERELSSSPSGVVWLDFENLLPVLDDYLEFASARNDAPNPDWMMQVRPDAEDHIRRKHYPRYPSKASMPRSLTDPGGEFDQRVVAYMREKWVKERTNFSPEDRRGIEEMKGVSQMIRALGIQFELQNNYIRYQARLMMQK